MKFPQIESLNPAQLAIARIVAPFNIKTIELIIEEKEFGSGTPEKWDKALADYNEWHRKLQSITSKVKT